jgi:hypothetical protein
MKQVYHMLGEWKEGSSEILYSKSIIGIDGRLVLGSSVYLLLTQVSPLKYRMLF